MREHAQAVVIGGGVIGCSILYHLTQLGWNEVVLLERNELTSGSTWHAAANIHGLHDNNNISRIQHYTMNLYKELEAITGQGCGVFQPGSLYLAQTPEREHQLRLQAAKATYYKLDFSEISRDEAERLHPLVNFDGIRCIMWEPEGGNVDPSGVTQAYASGARQNGASIHRFTPVTGTEQQTDGSWIVRTDKGDIRTQIVVNAAGLWGREVAAMAGIELPLIPTEHQYFVTEGIAQVAAMDRRLPSVADRDGEYYLRQEGNGLLVGAYEKDVHFWAEYGTPADFGHELFDDDLDRIEENLIRAIARVPVLGEAGIKRVINGPMIWSPDGNALFGPVPERRGYFCCNEFFIVDSGMAERYHLRYFNAIERPGNVSFESRTEAMCGFNVAGPRSRQMLQSLTDTSLATNDFAFMRSRQIMITGLPVIALRMSFTGDLGWELHCSTEDQSSLYDALLTAGKKVDAKPTGSRALASLRIEKGYGSWSREYSPEYWPHEVNLDGLCKMDKDFLNKNALLEVLQKPARERLVILALNEADVSASNADATGGEPIFQQGRPVGRVSSGAYGYSVGKSLALGFVKDVQPGEPVQVMVLGRAHTAMVLDEPPFDPQGLRLRA